MHGRIFDLRIAKRYEFDHRGVQLIFITHRSGAAFEITHVTALIGNNEGALKLPRLSGVNSKIRTQLQRTPHPFGDIYKRAIAEHRRIKRGKKVVRVRHHRAEIFFDELRMLLHRLGERTENHAMLGEFLLMRGANGDAVEHRIHCHARQALTLVQGHAEFFVGFQQLRIHLIEALRAILVLRARRGVVADRLIINGLVLHLRPVRLFHCLPMAKGFEPPFEQPLRLVFLGGDMAHHIFVKPGRQRVSLDVSIETPLIFLRHKAIDGFSVCAHFNFPFPAHAAHTPRIEISECVTLKPRGTLNPLWRSLGLPSKSEIPPQSSHWKCACSCIFGQ